MSVEEIVASINTMATIITIDYDETEDVFILWGVSHGTQTEVRLIPGARAPKKGASTWKVPARFLQLVALSNGNVFTSNWTQAALDARQRLLDRAEILNFLREGSLGDDADLQMRDSLKAFGITPKPGQTAAMAYLANGKRVGLFSELGAGKSLVVSGAAKLWGISPMLVIAPASVLINWQRELAKFDIKSVVLTGTEAQRRKVMENYNPAETPALICSYKIASSLSRIAGYGSIKLKRCNDCGGFQDIPDKRCEVHERWLNTINWRVVVVDEAQRISDAHNTQTRAVWQLTSEADYAWFLSATPIEQKAEQFWSLLHAIDPVEHPSFSAFCDRYILSARTFWGSIERLGLNPVREEEFRTVTRPLWRRDVKSGTPEVVSEFRTCVLAPKNAKAYKSMNDQMMAELPDGKVVMADNHLTKRTKLRLMANGECTQLDDGTLWLTGKSEKLDLMEDTIADFPEDSIILWFSSRRLMACAMDRFEKNGVEYAHIDGDVSAAKRQQAVDDFQSGKVRFILMNPAAGGEGITLTRARVSIWVMRPDSSILNEQADGRNNRYGSPHESILNIDLVTLDTVEEEILPRLAEKQLETSKVVG
jgi:SNF2 family DNA or RNA helicase